jgi:hypothetical protein
VSKVLLLTFVMLLTPLFFLLLLLLLLRLLITQPPPLHFEALPSNLIANATPQQTLRATFRYESLFTKLVVNAAPQLGRGGGKWGRMLLNYGWCHWSSAFTR